MQYSTLLFDFDYTLADATEGIVQSQLHAFSVMGLSLPGRESIRRTIGMTLPDSYTALTGDADPEHQKQFRALFVQKANEVMIPCTRALPGAVALLKRLREAGVSAGIVSTKYGYRITGFWNRLGLSDYISCVVGLDRVSRAKPDPEGVRLAMSLLDAAPEHTLYVGDTVIDGQTAQNAGVDFAAVLTGTTGREAFASYSPRCVAENLNELALFLGLGPLPEEPAEALRFMPADDSFLPETGPLLTAAKGAMLAAGNDQWNDTYPTSEDYRKDLEQGELYVLLSGARLAAVGALNEFQPEEYRAVDWQFREGRVCVLHRLCVHPEFQGRGLGGQMLRHFERLARQQGYGVLRLDTYSKNGPALSMYARAGFRRAGAVYFPNRASSFLCLEKALILPDSGQKS